VQCREAQGSLEPSLDPLEQRRPESPVLGPQGGRPADATELALRSRHAGKERRACRGAELGFGRRGVVGEDKYVALAVARTLGDRQALGWHMNTFSLQQPLLIDEADESDALPVGPLPLVVDRELGRVEVSDGGPGGLRHEPPVGLGKVHGRAGGHDG